METVRQGGRQGWRCHSSLLRSRPVPSSVGRGALDQGRHKPTHKPSARDSLSLLYDSERFGELEWKGPRAGVPAVLALRCDRAVRTMVAFGFSSIRRARIGQYDG